MWTTPKFTQHIPILKRLVPSLLRRYARHFKHRYVVESRSGVLMLLDQKNIIDNLLLIRGFWEPEQIDTLLQLSRDACQDQTRTNIFLDIGAHWGLYSLLMNKTGLFNRIIAFEPEATNYAQLQGNIFINQAVDAIEACSLAASNFNGEVQFEQGPECNRGTAKVKAAISDLTNPSKAIPCTRLDDMFLFRDACIVAKIDVEGHEISVLEGMKNLLRNNHFLLQIEHFNENDHALMDVLGDGYRQIKKIDHDYYFCNFKQHHLIN